MDIETAEWSLAELPEDPLIGLVLKSDGVDRYELALMLERVARERARAIKRGDVRALRPRLPTTETAP